MSIETTAYCDATAKAVHVDRDQSHADRALTDLEKAQAELDHVLTVLGTRLRPVTAVLDVPDGDGMVGADPSPRSPLVRSLITARERTQRQTRLVLEITEGLDV